jgi:hypothetical protein
MFALSIFNRIRRFVRCRYASLRDRKAEGNTIDAGQSVGAGPIANYAQDFRHRRTTMKLRRACQKSIAIMTIAIISAPTLSMTALAQAQPSANEHKLTLRAIMQDLGAEYLRLANALIMEDFKGIEESAKAIQGHPLPDTIVVAIKNKLGGKFGAFERADESSHRNAADLVKRAAARDVPGSAKAFAGITNGCIGCHRQFRATLRILSE